MQPQYAQQAYGNTKFCKYCWATIMMDAVVCTVCGRQVENLNQAQPQQIVINNTNDNVVNAPVHVNANTNVAVAGMKPKDKWIAFILCLFLGYWGVHKFYEGKVGWGLVYLFTGGLCGVGWIIDIIRILLKPNPYYT
ncbi:MAG: TM2 domain-containing protein [Lachnospiraceae bacterium]|nr:TM2 domain-containing protein [Lachnospiraceae bacterium]